MGRPDTIELSLTPASLDAERLVPVPRLGKRDIGGSGGNQDPPNVSVAIPLPPPAPGMSITEAAVRAAADDVTAAHFRMHQANAAVEKLRMASHTGETSGGSELQDAEATLSAAIQAAGEAERAKDLVDGLANAGLALTPEQLHLTLLELSIAAPDASSHVGSVATVAATEVLAHEAAILGQLPDAESNAWEVLQAQIAHAVKHAITESQKIAKNPSSGAVVALRSTSTSVVVLLGTMATAAMVDTLLT